jgi:regulatory protein
MISVITKEGAYNVKTILVDDEPWKDIHLSVFGRQELELTSIDQFDLLEYKKVKVFVYKKLSQKNYCSHELKKILTEYLVSPVVIKSVLDDCQNLGYINDNEWLKSFIRSAKTKKCGPFWILQKLMSKGIDKDTAKEALNAEDSSEDRVARIQELLKTRYRTRDLTNYSEKQKVVASLVRKGFSFEDIKASISTWDDN